MKKEQKTPVPHSRKIRVKVMGKLTLKS